MNAGYCDPTVRGPSDVPWLLVVVACSGHERTAVRDATVAQGRPLISLRPLRSLRLSLLTLKGFARNNRNCYRLELHRRTI